MTQSSALGSVPNSGGAAFRASLNTIQEAIVTENEGSSAPSPTYSFMLWRNNTAKILRRRNASNDSWSIVQNYGATTNPDSGNDSSEGYTQGSIWLNIASGVDWICTNATIGAAVWADLAAGSTGGTNAFGTIAVAGQSSVVADASPDSLAVVGQGGITVTTNASTDTVTFAPTYGTSTATICQGNDARLSDTRIPSAHASAHAPGGSDPISGVGGPTTFVVVAPRDGSGSAVSGFNAAIAAAINEGGGRIIVPYGIYAIDDEITIGNGTDPVANILIEGEGFPQLKRTANTTPYMMRLAQYATHCKIMNLEFEGQKTTYTTACDGIQIRDSFNTVENVRVNNISGNGIQIVSPDTDHDAVHNSVINSRIITAGQAGIMMIGAHYSLIINNYIESAVAEGIAVDIGTLTDGTDWTIVDGNLIKSCGGDGGIGIDGCTRLIVSNNIIWNTVGSGTFGNGITVQNNKATSDNLVITGNNCFSNAGYGIRLKGNGTISASGEYPPGTGGYCFSTTNCVLSGNNLKNNTGGEIFDDTSNTGNVCNAVDAVAGTRLDANVNPLTTFDDNDYTVYNRSSNLLSYYINSVQQLSINAAGPRFPPRTVPGSPLEGHIYYDSSAHNLKVYTGAGWATIAGPLQSSMAINARDYGAVGDGVTNDTVALQAALTAAANKCLYIPAGRYIVKAQLTLANAAVHIRGDGIGVTELRWAADAVSHGFNITSNNSKQFHCVRDMTLSSNRTSSVSGTAIILDYQGQMVDLGAPMGWTTQDRVSPRFHLENLWITSVGIVDSGDAFGYGWQTGVDTIAGMSGILSNVNYCGTATTPYQANASCNGFVFRGSATAYSNGHPVQFSVRACSIYFAQNGVTFNNCEGCYIDGGTNMVAVNYGVYCTSLVGHPQLNVSNTHINSGQCGIYADGQTQITINGCLIYCIQEPLADFAAIVLNNCDYLQIVHNIFASTNTSEFDANGVILQGGTTYGNMSNNCFMNGFITCIWLVSGTANCNGSNNLYAGTFSNTVLDQGTNNAVT